MHVTIAFLDGVIAGERTQLDVRDALEHIQVAVEPTGQWQVMGIWPPEWTQDALTYLYRRAEDQAGVLVYCEVPWRESQAAAAAT